VARARRAKPVQANRDCKANVQLLHIDGQVRALEVRCGCGDVTVVELDYDAVPDEGTNR
jgi:hypothetical protein